MGLFSLPRAWDLLSAVLQFVPLTFSCRRSHQCQFHNCSPGQSESWVPAARWLTPRVFCVRASDEVMMEEVGQAAQLRAGELIIIVVVLIMWAGSVSSSLTHTHTHTHTHCSPYRNLLRFGVEPQWRSLVDAGDGVDQNPSLLTFV